MKSDHKNPALEWRGPEPPILEQDVTVLELVEKVRQLIESFVVERNLTREPQPSIRVPAHIEIPQAHSAWPAFSGLGLRLPGASQDEWVDPTLDGH